MCQPKDKGGRRCPAHQPASIGMKKFMNEQYGLLPEQIEHTFKGLRAQAANRPAPTLEEYNYFIQRQKQKLSRAQGISDKMKRSIERQLDKELTESELPDGATFYALKKLQPRSREQKAEFVQMIREIATHRGTNRNEALRAFKEKYAEDENEYNSSFSNTFDGKSKAIAAALMGREGTTTSGMPEFSTEPRITHQPVQSTWITSMGYDPDDGRLEVNIGDRQYAYHNVPQDLWNRVQEDHGVLSREVFRRDTYAYESPEAAAADRVGRYCEDCHKYKAISGHICDFSAAEAREAELPDDIREILSNMEAEVPEEPESPAEPELSYESSLARLREKLENSTQEEDTTETEQAEETPAPRQRRRRTGPTARQRRWTRELSERETVDLSDSERGNVDGSRSRWSQAFTAPRAQDIRRAVIQQGDVATFTVTSPGRRGYEVDADGNSIGSSSTGQVQQEVKAYIDNADGTIKFERIGNPKCNCDAYRRNGHCVHLAGNDYRLSYNSRGLPLEELKQARLQAAEREVNSAINQLHQNVDRTSYLRSTASADEPITVSNSSRRGRNAQFGNIISQANLTATEWRSARTLLDSGETVTISLNDFSAMEPGDRSIWHSQHRGSANVTLKKVDDEYVVQNTIVRCYRCGRNEETCPHSESIGRFAVAGVRGEHESISNTGHATPQVDYENMEPAERLRQLNESTENTWTAKPEEVSEMSRFAAPTGVDHSYSANLDKYIADVRAAEERIKNGESAIPYTRENATDGICSPESGRGFGIEIEFDLPSGTSASTAGEAIAREMQAAGLSDIGHQTHYHGYRGSRWHIEQDCTVAGEVVSPILHDTPEHWEELEKVIDIIKRHGGRASVRTGGHVHMGLGSGEPAEIERRKIAATQIYAAYEDTIRRVQTDPNRKKHRDTQWCQPLGDGAQNNIYNLRRGYGTYSDHHTSLNLGHQGRIEFRGADGSLDVAHIQAQVVTAAAIVRAAERGELEGDTLKQSKIGSNAKKMKLISGGKQTQAKTDDELIVSDVDLRRFADDIMGTDHGRKIMAGIAANTPWQETKHAR